MKSSPTVISRGSGFPAATTALRALLPAAIAGAVLFVSGIASPAPIQRDIVVDGDTSEWKTTPSVVTNPGQFSGDPITYPPDRDAPQATGRDLAGFAYSWDDSNLFLWVQRAGSASNKTYWWFFLDTGDDGDMGTSDVLLLVTWQGNTGALTRTIFSYTPIRGGTGDPLVCPATGINSFEDEWCVEAGYADGYDMPGDKVEIKMLSDQFGGLPNGLEMETSIPWSELGGGGPVSVQFHISSSNGQNIPNQIDDNMDGPGGGSGALSFVDLELTKTASATSAYGNTSFTYQILLENHSTENDAHSVEVTDVLPGELDYQGSVASLGSYDINDDIWYVGTLPMNSSATLEITVKVKDVSSQSTATNTATLSQYDEPDIDSADNSSSVDVDLLPGPSLTVEKTVEVVDDLITSIPGNEKNIPGATVLYTITVTNSSSTAPAEAVVISDPIDSNTSFVANSITVNGSGRGDTIGDGDGSDFGETASETVTSSVGDVGPSSTVTVTFEVKID